MKEHKNYFNRNLKREDHSKTVKVIKKKQEEDDNKISNKALAENLSY